MFCKAAETLQQGDIIKEISFPQVGGSFPGICLTPICDLTPQEKSGGIIKADYVVFCLLTLDIEFFKVLFKDSTKTEKNVIGDIIPYLEGRHQRYHWVYNEEKEKGYIIDYQVIQSIPYKIAEKFERIASLKSSYKECLAARYSAYTGRIGIEDLEYKEIATKIAKSIGNS